MRVKWQLIVVIALIVAGQAVAGSYSVQVLPTLPEKEWGRAFSINNAGQVTGDSWSSAGGGGHAFLWDNGAITDLGAGSGRAINSSGLVAGIGYPPLSTARPAVSTGGGPLTALWTGAPEGWAYATNDNGWVAGQYSVGIAPGQYQNRAFLWKPGGTIINLGTLPEGNGSVAYGINSQGKVVGTSYGTSSNDQAWTAFVWDETHGMTPLSTLGGYRSEATAINDSGVITGYAYDSGNISHAVMWDADGTIRDLGWLNISGSGTCCVWDGVGRGINSQGQIVGSVMMDGVGHAFLWDPATGVMEDLLPVESYAGSLGEWWEPRAYDINDSGQIVGWGMPWDGEPWTSRAFLLTPESTPVPEPGSLLLLGSGLIGAAGFIRRKIGK